MSDLLKLHKYAQVRPVMAPSCPFEPPRNVKLSALELGLGRYSFRGTSDLYRNMLSRLLMFSVEDPVIAPSAQSMLRLLMEDQRTIFGRLHKTRTKNLNK